VSAAKTYRAEAERQTARVTVTITPGAVAVDGAPLELVEGGGPLPLLLAQTRADGEPEVPPSLTFDVLVDPGPHVFVLSVAGRTEVITRAHFTPGARLALELRAPDTNPDAAPPLTLAAEGRAAATPNRVPAYLALGMGAAAVTVGSVSGLLAFAQKSDVSRACQSADEALCNSERRIGNRAADIATGAFIAGGVALGVGAVLWFVAPARVAARPSRTATQPELRPMVGWAALGITGRF